MRRVDQFETEAARPPARERMFNAPWTILVICVGLVVLYGLQSMTVSDAEVMALGLTPAALWSGHWDRLFTSLFLHGSWPHVLMNSVAALAFGPPTARLFGGRARGAAAFFAYYLACGALAGVGFVLAAPHDVVPVVGASGAISGLLGGSSRLIEGRGRIGSPLGSTVLGMGAAWVIVNVALGVSGLTPGAEGMPVAWQAHIAGYLAGVLLVGAFARLAGAPSAAFAR